jgi:DNA-binding Xre family transcriptional regulator
MAQQTQHIGDVRASRTVYWQFIADNFKEAIEKKGIAQNEWSRRSGVPQGIISEVLSGKRTIPIYVFCALCDGLEVTPNDILGY